MFKGFKHINSYYSSIVSFSFWLSSKRTYRTSQSLFIPDWLLSSHHKFVIKTSKPLFKPQLSSQSHFFFFFLDLTSWILTLDITSSIKHRQIHGFLQYCQQGNRAKMPIPLSWFYRNLNDTLLVWVWTTTTTESLE